MASEENEVSEIASINQNVLANVAVADNQPAIVPNINASSDANRVNFNCVIPDCEFVTQDCTSEAIARDLLNMHIDGVHKGQSRGDRDKHVNKILVPEKLELDPAEDDTEELGFNHGT